MASTTRSFDTFAHDTTPTHLDLRSYKHALKREAKQSAKYYGYRGVHPSWIGQRYHALGPDSDQALTDLLSPLPHIFYTSCDPLITMPKHMQVATWTKRDMWDDRENDIFPLDRRHHKGKRIRDKKWWKWNPKGRERCAKMKTRALEFALGGADVESVDTCYFDFADVEVRNGCNGGEGTFSFGEESGSEMHGLDGNIALLHVGGGASPSRVDTEEDYRFSMISERDFDVISLFSDGEAVVDFEPI